MSGHEPWGRWTDAGLAPTARFVFAQQLPDRFTLELRASGLGPNAYQPVIVRVGAIEKSITLGNPPKEAYRIDFEGTNRATQIEIVPPAPILAGEVNPQNPDPRKLGLGIASIKILN
jgi:phosphoglycerol transferase